MIFRMLGDAIAAFYETCRETLPSVRRGKAERFVARICQRRDGIQGESFRAAADASAWEVLRSLVPHVGSRHLDELERRLRTLRRIVEEQIDAERDLSDLAAPWASAATPTEDRTDEDAERRKAFGHFTIVRDFLHRQEIHAFEKLEPRFKRELDAMLEMYLRGAWREIDLLDVREAWEGAGFKCSHDVAAIVQRSRIHDAGRALVPYLREHLSTDEVIAVSARFSPSQADSLYEVFKLHGPDAFLIVVEARRNKVFLTESEAGQ